MTHYNSYDSFKTKRSIESKKNAKEISAKKVVDSSFVLPQNSEVKNEATVINSSYKTADVLFNSSTITVFGMQGNIPCNQLVFPGDKVILDDKLKKITNVIERKTILSRDHKDSSRRSNVATNKILATNIDIAVIVVSAFSPPLHPKFIDRYLIILQNSGIYPIICLNKSDLISPEEEKILDIYRKLDLKVIETSTYTNQGIDELKNIIRGKQAIFVGHSGVGKSSLTNKLMGFDIIKTNDVRQKDLKGRHTTTSSHYYVWEKDSTIIDTPGIRSLDISNFTQEEIEEYFYEFSAHKNCKYKLCNHIDAPEKDCSVKQAVTNGDISSSRYDSYVRIIKDLNSD